MHGLRCLVAKRAARGVLQAAASKTVRRPASVEVGKPMEKPDSWWWPAFPCELPSVTGDGALEGSQVGRLRGVGAARAPCPAQAVRLGGECRVLNLVPELEILA